MLTEPEIVHAVTDKVCKFYHEANERFFSAAGDLVDGFFFGNDFGSQNSLMCGPDQFDEFILPWFKRFTVDCLHPLQAKACNMEAERLAKEFKGRIAFLGGIDAQQLMTQGTPEQIRADVHRVKRLLGPNLIVSPSHEAILPNVPPGNVAAMAQAAFEPDDCP
jgi:uroporphyrinogen decarboxylase